MDLLKKLEDAQEKDAQLLEVLSLTHTPDQSAISPTIPFDEGMGTTGTKYRRRSRTPLRTEICGLAEPLVLMEAAAVALYHEWEEDWLQGAKDHIPRYYLLREHAIDQQTGRRLATPQPRTCWIGLHA